MRESDSGPEITGFQTVKMFLQILYTTEVLVMPILNQLNKRTLISHS